MQIRADFTVPNTLMLASRAQWGCRVNSISDLQELIEQCAQQQWPLQLIGEGSNIVPRERVRGCVAVMAISGIKVLEESPHDVLLRVNAGESWHKLVMYCLRQGWFGLENLALIPGTVGAAPVQNIGAYGVEIADYIETVHVAEADASLRDLDAAACEFAYRNSIFKRAPGLLIHAVSLRLSKMPCIKKDYPDLLQWLQQNQISDPSPQQIATGVVAIRSAKLPDPAKVPNAGSFFKNPLIAVQQAEQLKLEHKQLKLFTADNLSASMVKLSAAQLIDMVGGKQMHDGAVRCWPRQPLVLVNQGHSDYTQLMSFAAALQDAVQQRFGVQLEVEPSLLS